MSVPTPAHLTVLSLACLLLMGHNQCGSFGETEVGTTIETDALDAFSITVHFETDELADGEKFGLQHLEVTPAADGSSWSMTCPDGPDHNCFPQDGAIGLVPEGAETTGTWNPQPGEEYNLRGDIRSHDNTDGENMEEWHTHYATTTFIIPDPGF